LDDLLELLSLLLEEDVSPVFLALRLETRLLCDASLFGVLLGLAVLLMTLNALTNKINETIAVGESNGCVRYAIYKSPS
jgi:hypothetical protein